MTTRRGPWLRGSAAAVVPAALVLAALFWAASTPIKAGVRDEIFEIPKGTWARRMAGDKVDILPSQIRLTLGVRDVLVLINRDDVPQIFGPVLMMPGQSFRLPFATASSYQFACSAHASGQMTVIVDAMPVSAWARVIWRIATLLRSGRWPWPGP
jgi:hypothetical protein